MPFKTILSPSVRNEINKFRYFINEFHNFLFAEKKPKDFKSIPIIINNFNRYTFLKELIDSLNDRGYHNIYIIDNNSSYPPLLEYYKTIPQEKLFLLNENLGHLSFIHSGIYKKFRNRFFVYTDSDILLPPECPQNILEHFYNILTNTPHAIKVGCALKIDDIPDHYAPKKNVQKYERQFWNNPLGQDIFKAVIDTTFALYKPNIRVGTWFIGDSFRVAGNYACKHQPWYIDTNNIPEEENYYMKTATRSSHLVNVSSMKFN